jgi:hypothetical protein
MARLEFNVFDSTWQMEVERVGYLELFIVMNGMNGTNMNKIRLHIFQKEIQHLILKLFRVFLQNILKINQASFVFPKQKFSK